MDKPLHTPFLDTRARLMVQALQEGNWPYFDDLFTALRGYRDGVAVYDPPAAEAVRAMEEALGDLRFATCLADVELAGKQLRAGDKVLLLYPSANRDAAVFSDPDAFDPAANAEHNLVYGIGPHVCPGRPLATLELRVAVQEALAATEWIDWAPGEQAEREVAPVGGYARVPVVLT